jgi:hypothetical protein
LLQRANDFFGVMDIHLAAEGLEVKRLLRARGHPGSQYNAF